MIKADIGIRQRNKGQKRHAPHAVSARRIIPSDDSLRMAANPFHPTASQKGFEIPPLNNRPKFLRHSDTGRGQKGPTDRLGFSFITA